MKTTYNLPSKTKWLFTLLLSFQYFYSNASVIINMDKNKVKVSIDQIGTAGYKGCETGKLKLANAYIYTLYRKQTKPKNAQTCSANSSGRWIKIAKKESNNANVVFPNMPLGEYKATVYAGQAKGCTIDGDTKNLPSKSIVYHQEKSQIFNFGNANKKLGGTEIVSNLPDHDAMSIFPNPTLGNLNIILKNHDLQTEANIAFYNLLGQEVLKLYRSINTQRSQEWQVDVSDLPVGAYILRVFDKEGNSYEKKVIVSASN